MFLYLKRF